LKLILLFLCLCPQIGPEPIYSILHDNETIIQYSIMSFISNSALLPSTLI
jgi:hypothetical protein